MTEPGGVTPGTETGRLTLVEAFTPLLSWAESVSQHHAMLRSEPPFTTTRRLDDALTAAYDALSGVHEPHHGNHDGYACGLSGPHCWACNEPWPCRAFRAAS